MSPVELIIWLDAFSVSEWCEVRDLCLDLTKVISVGFVVKENDVSVAITTARGPEDNSEIGATMVIPKSAIIHRKMLADAGTVAGWLKA